MNHPTDVQPHVWSVRSGVLKGRQIAAKRIEAPNRTPLSTRQLFPLATQTLGTLVLAVLVLMPYPREYVGIVGKRSPHT